MKRRDILKNGTLAGATILLPVSGAFAAQGELARHKTVISALSKYSGRVLPALNGTEVHLLASIDRLEAFTDDVQRGLALPYENMHAQGNVISFTQEGVRYKVENVLPQHFEARAKELG